MALALAAATTAAAADPFEAQKSDQERQHQDALLMSELLGQYADAQQSVDGDRAAFAHAATGVRLATADCSLEAHEALAGQYGLRCKHPHGRMFNFTHVAPDSVLQGSTAVPAVVARAIARDRASCRQGISKRWMRKVLKSSHEHNEEDYLEMQALLASGRLLFYRRLQRDAYSSINEVIAPDKVARTSLLEADSGRRLTSNFQLAGITVRADAPVKLPVTDFLPRHTEVMVRLPGGPPLHSVLQSEGNLLTHIAASRGDPSALDTPPQDFFGRVLEHSPDGTYRVLHMVTKKPVAGVPRRFMTPSSEAYQAGLVHHHTNFKRSALLSMLEAIRHAPWDVRPYVVAADLLLTVSRMGEARVFARRVTLLQPENPMGHLLLGRALLMGKASLGTLWEAVLCLRAAHRLEPWHPRVSTVLNEGEARLWNALKMEAGKNSRWSFDQTRSASRAQLKPAPPPASAAAGMGGESSQSTLYTQEQHTGASSSLSSVLPDDAVSVATASDSMSIASDAAASLPGTATAHTFMRPGVRLVLSRGASGRASSRSVASLPKGDPGMLRWATRDRPMAPSAAATALVGETSARVTRDAMGLGGGVEARAMHDPGSYAPAFVRTWAVGHMSGATMWGRPIAFVAHTALDAASASLYCSSIGGSILHKRHPPRLFGQPPTLKLPSATPLQYVLNGGGGRQRARSRLASRLAATRALVGRGFVSSAAGRPSTAPGGTALPARPAEDSAPGATAPSEPDEEDLPAAKLTVFQGRGTVVTAGWQQGQFEVDEHLPPLPGPVRADALNAADEAQPSEGSEGGLVAKRGVSGSSVHSAALEMPFEADEEAATPASPKAPPPGLVMGFDTVLEGEEEADEDASPMAKQPSPRHRRWASLQLQLKEEAAAVTMASLARGGSSALGVRGAREVNSDDDEDVVQLGPLQSLSKGGAVLQKWDGLRARFRIGGAAAWRPDGSAVVLAPTAQRSSGGGFFATVQAVRRRATLSLHASIAGAGSLGPAAVQLLGSSLKQDQGRQEEMQAVLAQSESEAVIAAEAAAVVAEAAAAGNSSDSSSDEGGPAPTLRTRSVVQRAGVRKKAPTNMSPRKMARAARRAAREARSNMVAGLLDHAVDAAWAVAGHDEADTLGYVQVASSEQLSSCLVASMPAAARYYVHVGARAVSHVRTVQRLPMAATAALEGSRQDVAKLLFGDSDEEEPHSSTATSALDHLAVRPSTSGSAVTTASARAAVVDAAAMPAELAGEDEAQAKQRREEAALSKRIVRIGAIAARYGSQGADSGWRPATPADELVHTAERARRTVLARLNADRVRAGFHTDTQRAVLAHSRLSTGSGAPSQGLAELAVGFDPELVVSPRRPATGVPRTLIPSKWQPLLMASCKFDLVYPPLPMEIKAFRKAHPELVAAYPLTELPASKARGAMVQMAFAGHLQLVSTAGVVPSKKKKRKKGGQETSRGAGGGQGSHRGPRLGYSQTSVTLDNTEDLDDDDAHSHSDSVTQHSSTVSGQGSTAFSATGVKSSPLASTGSHVGSRAGTSTGGGDDDDEDDEDALLSVTGDWEDDTDSGDVLEGDDEEDAGGRGVRKQRPRRAGPGKKRPRRASTGKKPKRAQGKSAVKSLAGAPEGGAFGDMQLPPGRAKPAAPAKRPSLEPSAEEGDLAHDSPTSEITVSDRPGLPDLMTSGPSDLEASDFESPRPPASGTRLQWQEPSRRQRQAAQSESSTANSAEQAMGDTHMPPRPPASVSGSGARAVRSARAAACADSDLQGGEVQPAPASTHSSSPHTSGRTPQRKRSRRMHRSGSRGSFGSRTSGDKELMATVDSDLVSYRDIIARLEGDAVCVRASAVVSERNVLSANGRAMRIHLLALLESGQWYRELRLALKVGRRYLRTVLPTKKSLVVFDVDDTALSSVVYMARTHFARHPSASPDWYHCARVPALLPVLEFYHLVLHMGFQVVFLSERPSHAFHATKEALVRAGFTTFKHLITRPPQESQVSTEPRGTTASAVKTQAVMRAGQFKFESREALLAQGYDIVAVVGDQDSDFAGGHTGMCVKLPNYLYMEE